MWLLVVIALYPVCRWFAEVEAAPTRRLAELSLIRRGVPASEVAFKIQKRSQAGYLTLAVRNLKG